MHPRALMRRPIAVLATLSLLAVGAGCGSSSNGSASSAGGNKSLDVAFANFTENSPIFHVLHTSLADQLKAHPDSGVNVSWYDNGGDSAKMVSNARLMVTSKPDFIIEYPVVEHPASVGRLFSRGKVPCVSINLPTPGCPFLNIDTGALGEGVAQVVGKIAKARGWDGSNTTVLLGQNAVAGPGVNNAVVYFYPKLAKILGLDDAAPSDITPKTTTIGKNGIQFDAASDQQKAFDAVRSLLASIPRDRNLIVFTINDAESLGAYTAIKGAGRLDNALVAGLGGGVAKQLQLLQKDPHWVAEAGIFSPVWGEYAVAMGQAMLKGAKTPDVTPLPQAVITKDNLSKYYDVDTLKRGSIDFESLPPLVEKNQYLAQGGFLQSVGNVAGLK